jgi:1,4-alpha-glucan branching enzyme
MKKKVSIENAHPAADNRSPMKRKYSKNNTQCRVTFRFPGEAAPGARSVAVAGSFNDWCVDRHPMKRLKNGDFSLEVALEAGREYEFRFIIDGIRWENAWNADKYVWSDHANCENSVVVT